MSAIDGQAAGEYAGLLGLAAILGATLALIAGPPLVDAMRAALADALVRPGPAVVVPTAADIADVQSALAPGADAPSPDAALLALGRRHGAADAAGVAHSLVLAAARKAVPWIGTTRTYRPVSGSVDTPFGPHDATGDRDVESATGPPTVTWVTVAGERRALGRALAHHTRTTAVVLDVAGLIPVAKPFEASVKGVRALAKAAAKTLPKLIDWTQDVADASDVVRTDDGGVPPGLRAGDVVVDWPVRRTFWRDGRSDASAPAAYVHRLVLRPGDDGLRVIAEEIAA